MNVNRIPTLTKAKMAKPMNVASRLCHELKSTPLIRRSTFVFGIMLNILVYMTRFSLFYCITTRLNIDFSRFNEHRFSPEVSDIRQSTWRKASCGQQRKSGIDEISLTSACILLLFDTSCKCCLRHILVGNKQNPILITKVGVGFAVSGHGVHG